MKESHPSRGTDKVLNVYLPWDEMGKGDSFFIAAVSRKDHARRLKAAARRRGFEVVIEEVQERIGHGIRVKRVT